MSNSAINLRQRIDELADEPATSWRPAPGDVLVGTLLDIDTRDTKFDATVPVLTIRSDDDGKLVECWALHTVLRSELAKRRPQIGERLAIRRLSDSGRGYKRFRVIVDRDKPAAFDWDSVPVDGGDVDAVDRPRLLSSSGETVVLPAAKPSTPFDDSDDDLPF